MGVVEQARPSPSPLARLGLALLVAGLGALGAAVGEPDPVRLLIWLALVAAAAGYLLGALGVGLLPYGIVAPGVWMVVLVGLDGVAERDLPTPLWAALGWTGLFAVGVALGRVGRRVLPGSTWSGAGALLLAAALTTGLAGRGGLGDRPWPPEAARRLLDLSPATLLVESAGVDWMRHPAVYDAAGTDRFERAPYRGSLAGPLTFVVGCLLFALVAACDRRSSEKRPP